MNSETIGSDNECQNLETDVGKSRYLPSGVLSVIRVGLGIHLLVNGMLSIFTQRPDPYWRPYIPLWCGYSLIVLGVCAALESADIKPNFQLCEAATVLHMFGCTSAFASLAKGVVHHYGLPVHPVFYILLDFALGARIAFRFIHIPLSVFFLALILTETTSMQNIARDLGLCFAASSLVFALPRVQNCSIFNKPTTASTHQPTQSMYQAI